MSKAKRVEIVKVTVIGPDGTLVEVDGKSCSKCLEVKALSEYTMRSDRNVPRSRCKPCVHEDDRMRRVRDLEKAKLRSKRYYENNKQKIHERQRRYVANNRHKIRDYQNKWRDANKERLLDKLRQRRHADWDNYLKQVRDYRDNNKEKVGASRREWYHRNKVAITAKKKQTRMLSVDKYRDSERLKMRRYREVKPEICKATMQRRRTRKKYLPESWESGDILLLESLFGGKCAVKVHESGDHADHFIALRTGHGGTYNGNMIPLCPDLNHSKSFLNPFTWFQSNKQQMALPEERWSEIISYLANQNGLTPDEFREYVDWCYANPRTVDDIKRDNERYGYTVSSVELWQAATGRQFPIRINFRSSDTGNRSIAG